MAPYKAPKAKRNKIRILLVDDQEMVRQGLKMRLAIEDDFEVVGEASDGRVSVLVADLHPDVILMDVEMPGMDGIAGTVALGESAPRVAVVMLSLYDDDETRGRASTAGAVGFVGKHQPEDMLVKAIREAIRNVPVIPPTMDGLDQIGVEDARQEDVC